MGNSLKKERNYGIDLFKIFSMFMVVFLHALDGTIVGCEPGSTNHYIVRFMQSSVYIAVNCFALSSGYILINIKYRFNRIINMWFQVVFYSVLITIPFFIFMPEVCSKGILLQSCFPILAANRYWYFSAYFVLFMLMPFINLALHSITKKQHLCLCLVLFVIFSIFPLIAFDTGTYQTYKGFSFFWLSIVYIWGAYFGKYGFHTSKKADILVYAICTITTFLSCYQFFVSNIPVLSYIASRLTLYRYDSPTLVCASLALLSLFSKIRITQNNLIKIINLVTPLTFGVYLIHNNQMILHQVTLVYLSALGKWNSILLILTLISISVVVFIICLFLDWLRMKLFNLIRIPLLSKKIGDFIESKAKAIANKLIKL